MARIQAGSTLVNQYVPPFVICGNITTGWELRWNADLLAFEAYDPSASVIQSGFDGIQVSLFPDATQQVFVVPWEAATKESVFVTIQGVKQQQDAYTIKTNTGAGTTVITLSDTVLSETVEILGLQTSGGASIEVYQETASAAQTLFPTTGGIGWLPPSEASLIITIDGVKQTSAAYNIIPNANSTDAAIQFVSAPGDGVVIEVVGILIAGSTPASPVNVVNAYGLDGPTVYSTFANKTLSGDVQNLNFKSLEAGTNITIGDNTNRLTISATQPTISNLGAGGTNLAVIPGGTDDVELRGIASGDNISISEAGGVITVARNFNYITSSASTINITTERLINVTPSAPTTVNLPAANTVVAGDTITVKDANGTAGTNTISITPNGADEIDGVNASVDITSNRGYLTLYSDGISTYHIIAQG